MNGSLAKAEQLSIFLENRSGQLSQLVQLLGDNGINIRALSLADTSDFGILRLIVSDPANAAELLKDAGFTLGKSSVIAVELPDKPGSLGKLLQILSQNELNIEYMYACSRREAHLAVIIFRFDRTDAALALLRKHDYTIIEADQLYKI